MLFSNLRMRFIHAFQTGCSLILLLFFASSLSVALASGQAGPDGSYSYRIPIEIPAGINGVQPDLSIGYNSNSGNSSLGIGWRLHGLPVITRMNYGNGINYQGNDTYVGPEGRLIAVGSGNYRTENDNAGLYTAYSQSGDGPGYWTARDKQGNTYYYGKEDLGSHSRIEAVDPAAGQTANVRVWALSRFEDANGNAYKVNYIEDAVNGDYYPSSITYTHHPSGSASDFSLHFSYLQTRSDQAASFRSGAKVVVSRRLDTIDVKAGNTVLSTYSFAYETAALTGESRLISVVRTAGSLSRTYSFQWSNRSLQLTESQPDLVASPLDLGGNFPNSRLNGDFNGDGLDDFMYLNSNQYWVMKQSNGDGSFTAMAAVHSSVLTPDVLDWGANFPRSWLTGEFNGDGRTDFMYLGTDSNWHVKVSNGDGSFSEIGTHGQSVLTGQVLDWGRSFPNSWQTGDFNGDGLTDFMYLGTDDNWRMYLANGTGGFDPQPSRTRTYLTDKILDWGANFPHTWLQADFNGDGKQDFMYLDTDTQWQVRLSLGNGDFKKVTAGSRDAVTPGILDWGNHYPNARLQGDFNGDGNSDFIYLDTSGNWNLCLSVGNGTFSRTSLGHQDSLTPHILDFGRNFPNTWQTGDYNGDGKTDIRYYTTQSNWQTLLATGNLTGSFFVKPDNSLEPTTPNPLDWGGNYPHAWLNGDYNGDGVQDIVYQNSSQQWRVKLSTPSTMVVEKIAEPFNRTIAIAYDFVQDTAEAINRDAGTPPAQQHCGNASGYGYRQPCGIADTSSRFLVTEIRSNDGRSVTGGTLDNEDVDTLLAISYQNGRFSPGTIEERQILGFETITHKRYGFSEANAVLLSTQITRNRQDGWFDFGDGNGPVKSPFAALPYQTSQSVRQDGVDKLVAVTDYFYNEDKAGLYPVSGNTEVTRALQTKRLTAGYQGGIFAHKTIEEYGYDGNGRKTLTQSCVKEGSGAPGASSLNDCVAAEIERVAIDYIAWSPGDNWNAELAESVVKSVGGNSIEEVDYEYDANHRLSAVKNLLFCELPAECSGSGWIPVQQYLTYNDNGLPTYKEDALGNAMAYTYNSSNPGLVQTATLTDVDNAETYVQNFDYYSDGLLKEKSDFNQQLTAYQYDTLGRQTRQTNAKGGIISYQYADGNPDSDLFFQKTIVTDEIKADGQTATQTKIEYLDAEGFKYRVETSASDDPTRTTVVDNRKTYQGAKLTAASSRPYFSGATAEEIHWDKTTYDEFSRMERVDMADQSYVRYEYLLNEVRKITTHVDENETVTETTARTTFDKKGRLYQKFDQLGQETLYTFDDANRVTRVDLPSDENSISQNLTVHYDSLGRRTSLSDPSLGLTTFKYDNAGRLTDQTDHLGRITRFTYDGLNRVVTKTTHYGSTNEETVSYTYDQNQLTGLTSYPRGRVTQVTDATGTRKYAYNEIGALTTQVRDLNGLGTGYTETYTYSKFGKPLTQTYPDGSVKSTEYDGFAGHRAVSLKSAADEVLASAEFSDYNAARQMQTKQLGNGVKTDYRYTATGYLQTLQTCQASGGICNGDTIQDLTYDFYDYGMVKSITDNRSSNIIKDGYNTDATQHFVYDEIGRLTKATWGTTLDPTEIIEYEYNSIGNQKKRTVTDYTTASPTTSFVAYNYDGQKVEEGFNAVSQDAASRVFNADYDTLGNMNRKVTKDASGDDTAWDYVYDNDNRLIRVYKNAVGDLSTNSPVTEFTYDFAGQRTRKIYNKADGTTVTTWYVTPTFEIRDVDSGTMTATKYLTVEGKGKIASLTATYTPQQAAVFTANRHLQYAGMIATRTLDDWTDKLYHRFMAFAVHPASGKMVRKGLQIAFLLIFLGLMLFVQRKGRKQLNSSFAAWQRFSAVPLLCIFFLASCQTDFSAADADSGGIAYLSDDGTYITRNIIGDTSDGVPLGTYYYHVDHLGSSTVITSKFGIEVTRIAYNPFGELVQKRSWGQNVITHKFTSQELDEETGLMYYNARFYDPSIQRFITPDAVVPDPMNAQGYNRYAYVINNPVKYTDPTGHSWLTDELEKISDGIKRIVDGVKETVDDVVDEVSTAVPAAYHRIQHHFVHCKPLRMAGMIVASYYGGPWGAAAYSAWIAKSAGASDQDALKVAVVSGLSSWAGQKVNGMKVGFGKVIARGTVGGLTSKALGGSFEKGFKRGAEAESLSWFMSWYTGHGRVKYDPATKPAGPKPPGVDVVDPDRNNIGLSNNTGWFGEGGPMSRAMNKFPGMNSMSVYHDVWAGREAMDSVQTVYTIFSAIPTTYTALGYHSSSYEDELKSQYY